jgi:hypothetical protein
MNAVQIHLMLNHVPVLTPFLAVLLIAGGLALRSQPVLRVAMAILVLGALVAVPVYLTGEPVEKATEGVLGTAEQRIEPHESAAMMSLVLLGALGLAAGVGLITYRRRSVPGWLSGTILTASLIVAGQVAWTAHLGGQIRHTELQGGSTFEAIPSQEDRDD